MSSRGYFDFCTSLRPVELKALGGLSQVRHLAAGETIYTTGDAATSLYIISRGVVELIADAPEDAGTGTFLSRGDVLGDVELLTDTPRKYTARTSEQASLQCFDKEALPELLRTVPSFFRYLCEQLAVRLLHARGTVALKPAALELSGSLANFDLVTIYQTIVSSLQTGELTIFRENGEVLAAFSFHHGHASGGHFEHLRGDEAFWQLFQTVDLRGTFSFTSDTAPSIHVLESGLIERNPDELLIAALQSRDELDALRRALPDPSARLEPLRKHLDLEAASTSESGPLLGQVWERSCSRPTTLGDLYAQFLVSELKIYRVVDHLVKTAHLRLSHSPAVPQKVA
jgi:CRP/FNR family transcriptional regulator, cyclic AMP receptor protein